MKNIVTVKFSDDDHQQLVELAQRYDMPKGWLLRNAFKRWAQDSAHAAPSVFDVPVATLKVEVGNIGQSTPDNVA